MNSFIKSTLFGAAMLSVTSALGCADVGESESDEAATLGTAAEAITSGELSTLVLGGVHPVTNKYAPNGVHAGIDFGSVVDGVTTVSSPVNGTIVANTSSRERARTVCK